MRSRALAISCFVAAAVLLAACSSNNGGGGSSASAASSAAPSAASSAAASAASATVKATSVGSIGTVLVDGATGKTVYTFAKDVKDSGKSNCTGGCLTTWPALIVPAGFTPTAGDGVTGKLGTITRADNGDLQVTYNGLPLYFFSGDNAPGDANGVYTNWAAVKP